MFWIEKLEKTTQWLKKLWKGKFIDRFLLICILLGVSGLVIFIWLLVILTLVEVKEALFPPRPNVLLQF